jgi:hypothetical protein
MATCCAAVMSIGELDLHTSGRSTPDWSETLCFQDSSLVAVLSKIVHFFVFLFSIARAAGLKLK